MNRTPEGNYGPIVVFKTAPDVETAHRIAREIVAEGLAACCNILPEINSIYTWKGEVQEEKEVLMIIKTTAQRFPELQAKVVDIHPYDVPELIAMPISRGLPAYLEWLVDTVHPEQAQEKSKDTEE